MVLVSTPAANAVLLNFEFTGTVGAGTTLDLGQGVVQIPNGTSLIITGMTTSDTDAALGSNNVGQYAAMATFALGPSGSLGVFTTDATTDFGYTQVGTGDIDQIGLGSPLAAPGSGAQVVAQLNIAGDPNGGGVPVPLYNSIFSGGISPWVLTNGSGQTLHIVFNDEHFLTSAVATAKGVPDGGTTFALLGLGLLGLAGVKRKLGRA